MAEPLRYTRICDDLAYMLIFVNDHAEMHAVDGRIAIGKVKRVLQARHEQEGKDETRWSVSHVWLPREQ